MVAIYLNTSLICFLSVSSLKRGAEMFTLRTVSSGSSSLRVAGLSAQSSRIPRTQRGELLQLLKQSAQQASLEFGVESQQPREEVLFSRQFIGALQEARQEAERSAQEYSAQEMRAQRRASERERLTNALNSALQRVSPQMYIVPRVSSVPAVSSALEEVAIRASMKRLFGEQEETYKNSSSFLRKISMRLFGSRRKELIEQIKISAAQKGI